MAFQQPASLPDYSKLVGTLNTSGVQKWNPALYDILKQLIGAVQQSQDVISTNLDTLSNNPSSLTSVSVDAAGALSGDGTVASPLAVKVDGATITIVGDQLVASAPSSPLLSIVANFPGGTGFVGSTGTTISAIPGKVIVPLAYVLTSSITATPAVGCTVQLRYKGTGITILTSTIYPNTFGDFIQTGFFGSISFTSNIFANVEIEYFGNSGNSAGLQAGASITIYYTLY